MDEHIEQLKLEPPWRQCLKEMREAGIRYGATFAVDWLETRLDAGFDSLKFNLGIAEIRKELERGGFFLSTRGQRGTCFVVLPPVRNQQVVAHYQRQLVSMARRSVALGANTDLSSLSEGQRRRHEAILERAAHRAALLCRQLPKPTPNGTT